MSVVDSDADEVALILRVQAKVGYVPLHVGLVTQQQPVQRIPHLLLGRDVLNTYRVLLDGPQLALEIERPADRS